jgi:hypothetical protein
MVEHVTYSLMNSAAFFFIGGGNYPEQNPE